MEKRSDAAIICLNIFMKKTRQIIDDYKAGFSEFQYYHNILDKIEENREKMPDIAIESCKSLVEGVSKTILNKLKVAYSDKGVGADTARNLFKKVLDSIPSAVSCDVEFVDKICALITRMTEIRNKRGDISHGRLSPKEEESDKSLAEFIAHVTDGTIYYLLKIYFTADLSYLEEMKYEDSPEFNQSLDENYQLDGIVSYSRALFDQDLTSYRVQRDEYLFNEKEMRA